MKKEYDVLVFIGRFQPFHNGHAKVISEALNRADRVIVLKGSSNAPRAWRNPWTFTECSSMMTVWFNNPNLTILPLDDTTYNNDLWLENVQRLIASQSSPGDKIGLIGHSKDHTSYYLNLFPQWGNIEVAGFDDKRLLDATWVRNMYFSEGNSEVAEHVLPALVPENVHYFLKEFYGTPEHEWLMGEHEYYVNYQKPYANLPHGIIHQTTDAVVIQSGHVLVIERKARPGKGLLAMPGGFLNQNETIYDGVVRELVEETQLKVAERVLNGSMVYSRPFDDPNRSSRGRVITNAHLFALEPRASLPKVRGRSDAKRAFWLPIGELDPMLFFEDHYHIIQYMKNVQKKL